jgi:hydrogenase nickel incorporation protein HypB
MICGAIEEFPLEGIELLFIENVGNLVCPASFSIGEDIKVSVISVTEGADKPAKYPKAIRVSSAMVLTKTDLLPYIECDMERMERDALAIHPEIEVFKTSAKAGEGVPEFLLWIEEAARSRRASDRVTS